jgi:hypothetical protein
MQCSHNCGSKVIFIFLVVEITYKESTIAAITKAKPNIRSSPAKGTLNAFSKKHTRASIAKISLTIRLSPLG